MSTPSRGYSEREREAMGDAEIFGEQLLGYDPRTLILPWLVLNEEICYLRSTFLGTLGTSH